MWKISCHIQVKLCLVQELPYATHFHTLLIDSYQEQDLISHSSLSITGARNKREMNFQLIRNIRHMSCINLQWLHTEEGHYIIHKPYEICDCNFKRSLQSHSGTGELICSMNVLNKNSSEECFHMSEFLKILNLSVTYLV